MKTSIEVHVFFSLIFVWLKNMPDCEQRSISKKVLIFHSGYLAPEIFFDTFDEYRQVRLYNVQLFMKRYLNFALIGPIHLRNIPVKSFTMGVAETKGWSHPPSSKNHRSKKSNIHHYNTSILFDVYVLLWKSFNGLH